MILVEKLCCGWVVVFSLKKIVLGLGLWCLIVKNCVDVVVGVCDLVKLWLWLWLWSFFTGGLCCGCG